MPNPGEIATPNTLNRIPGTPAVLRAVWRGQACWAVPVRVVRDDPDLVALYWCAGTWGKGFSYRVPPADLLGLSKLTPQDWQWTRTDVLALTRPGDGHSVYLMRAAGWGAQDCWYINLQEPLRRVPCGFETMDQVLDVVVSPDFSRWRWKDEDEFAEAERIGLYSPRQASEIRAEGERALQLLLGAQKDFFQGWQSWSPPTQWQIPNLPENWAQV